MAAPPGAPLYDCTKTRLFGTATIIGLVTDVGGINDGSFNQMAWDAVRGAEACGALVGYIETRDFADYAENITLLVEEGYNVIVTVGAATGEVTHQAAQQYPDVIFIGIDQYQTDTLPNLIGLIFQPDRAGFLAGALAACLTQTGAVAAVMATDSIPPMVAYKEGFEAGARYIMPFITVLSTYHPGDLVTSFTDPGWGAQTARQALNQNADVVFAVGGRTGSGALIEVANTVGAGGPPPYCVGVEIDQWLTVPEAHPCLVSSGMLRVDQGVAQIIAQIAQGIVPAGNVTGPVGLAPYHDLEGVVSNLVKAEMDRLAANLNSGVLWTGVSVQVAEVPTLAPTMPPLPPTATPVPAAPTITPVPTETSAPTAVALAPVTGVVRVGVNAEYPPFEFVDQSGRIVGFDRDLMDAIAARAGFEIEWINTRWDSIFVALQSGEFDVVASAATITETREQIVDFSQPYFNAGPMIAVRKADAGFIRAAKDLSGRRVGVQTGTTADILASRLPGVQVVRYDDVTQALLGLASRDIGAVVADGPFAAQIIAENPVLGLVLVGEPLADDLYGIAVNSNRPELLAAINAALADIIADGTYRDIYLEWFEFEPPPMFQPAGAAGPG